MRKRAGKWLFRFKEGVGWEGRKWHRMKFCGDGSILSLGCARMLLGNTMVQHSKAEVGNRSTDLFSLFLLTTCAPTTTSKKTLNFKKVSESLHHLLRDHISLYSSLAPSEAVSRMKSSFCCSWVMSWMKEDEDYYFFNWKFGVLPWLSWSMMFIIPLMATPGQPDSPCSL